jgi:hypothetical protein
MANEIRIKTSVEILQDNDTTVEGITYVNRNLDGNADGRRWGGEYKTLPAYSDDKVCYWKNVIVSLTSVSNSTGLSDSAWTEAADVTDGAICQTANVIAVEYVKQSIGADTTIKVYIGAEIHAALSPGEAIVIPLSAGELATNLDIVDTNYANGTREAMVNVMIAGGT